MLATFNITQTGTSHINNNKPCQDFSQSIRITSADGSKDYILAAVADGVGSCQFSHVSSEQAVMTCIEELSDHLKTIVEIADEEMVSTIKSSFMSALSKVISISDDMQLPILEFDTTLTVVIFDGKSIWYGHIGDDGIVSLKTDGSCEMITTRHEGEEANSVIPLRAQDCWEFGTSSDIASFAIMTDGLLDYCVDGAAMNNRVFFPFLEPALSAAPSTDNEVELLVSDWNEFLLGEGDYELNIREAVMDDITLAVGINTDAVDKIAIVDFDIDTWRFDSKRRAEEVDELLYGEFRKFQDEFKGDK